MGFRKKEIYNDVKETRAMTAEEKVKSVYPEAQLRFGWIRIPSKYDWYTDEDGKWMKERYLRHIWTAHDKILSWGGKFEHILWRKAWKQIQKEMLKKLES